MNRYTEEQLRNLDEETLREMVMESQRRKAKLERTLRCLQKEQKRREYGDLFVCGNCNNIYINCFSSPSLPPVNPTDNGCADFSLAPNVSVSFSDGHYYCLYPSFKPDK